jgi:predicted lysophospholipase L1 biosynthesis ABC-type transport system permease subunit
MEPSTRNEPTALWEIGRLRLDPRLVLIMAVSSLRVRLGRTFLTVLTITTATAFLIYLLTMPRNADRTEQDSWLLMMALSLLVSGAGVLNTMLMSVSQRYREIGTIKCLGALDSFVLLSVLVESALVGLAGAVLGVVAGLLISALLAAADHGTAFAAHLALDGLWWKVCATFGIGMVLTTVGAAIPAFIASRMPPMDAMRGEK